MNRVALIAAGTLLLGNAAPALAEDTITFGQFFQQDGGQRLFRYKNEDSNGDNGAEIYATSSVAWRASVLARSAR